MSDDRHRDYVGDDPGGNPPKRGKGCSWSKASIGCDLRLYGWTNFDERDIALESSFEIERAVAEEVPEATVEVRNSPDPDIGIRINVRVAAAALAVFEYGPMHKAAIARARGAAGRALESCSWTRVRLALTTEDDT